MEAHIRRYVHPAISNPRLLQLSVFILMMNSQIYYFHNTLFSVNWQLFGNEDREMPTRGAGKEWTGPALNSAKLSYHSLP